MGSVASKNGFDELVEALLQAFSEIDDCLDGLGAVCKTAFEKPNRHREIFSEAYLLGLSHLEELLAKMDALLQFPFHQLMDLKIAETVYTFAQGNMRVFSLFVKRMLASGGVSRPEIALHRYKEWEAELQKVHRFVFELKEWLKELYMRKKGKELRIPAQESFKKRSLVQFYGAFPGNPTTLS